MRSKVKILFVAHSYPPAPQTFSADEVRAWRENGLDVEVLSFRTPPEGSIRLMPAQVRTEIQSTRYLRTLPVRYWVRGVLALCKRPSTLLMVGLKLLTGSYLRVSSLRLRAHSLLTLLRSVAVTGVAVAERVDLVHADFADDTATAAWVAHHFSGRPFSFRDHFSFNPQLLEDKLMNATVVLACCEANRQVLRGLVPDCNVATSYLGIDVGSWTLRKREMTPSQTILCAGTLQEKKGQKVLVEACALLRRQGVSFQCVLAGDGPDRGALQSLIDANDLGDVVLIRGYVPQPQVRELMLESSIFVLPSVVTSQGDSEGIPVALMEAMALGLACVSTPTGGIAELITDGVDGVLMPPGDPKGLADQVRRLLHDDASRERLGKAARDKIRNEFNIRQNGARSAQILCSLPSVTHPKRRLMETSGCCLGAVADPPSDGQSSALDVPHSEA